MRQKTFLLFLMIALTSTFNKGHANLCYSPIEHIRSIFTGSNSNCGTAFVTVGGGYSWSIPADISANPAYWDVASQGYDHDVDNSELYTFGLGYHTPSIFSFLLEVGYRPNYKYERYQTSSASNTPEFTPIKTRHFELSSSTYTFNAFLNKAGNYACWSFRNCLTVSPYVGGGLGVSYNTLYNFHSVLPLDSEGVQEVKSIMNDWQKTSFAGQVMIGLTTKINSRLSIDFGYRWFYGGKFESNDYLSSSSQNPIVYPQKIAPWKGKLRANELYVNFNYSL